LGRWQYGSCLHAGLKLCAELATEWNGPGWGDSRAKVDYFLAGVTRPGVAESELRASTVNNDFCHRSPGEMPPAKFTCFFYLSPSVNWGKSLAFGFPAATTPTRLLLLSQSYAGSLSCCTV